MSFCCAAMESPPPSSRVGRAFLFGRFLVKSRYFLFQHDGFLQQLCCLFNQALGCAAQFLSGTVKLF
jgi:hypothetical protein